MDDTTIGQCYFSRFLYQEGRTILEISTLPCSMTSGSPYQQDSICSCYVLLSDCPIFEPYSFFKFPKDLHVLQISVLMFVLTDYGRPERKKPSLHGQKFTRTPTFLGTAEAYFVCHIGPNFQISLIHAFMGCP